MRYVEARFATRLRGHLAWGMGTLLVGVIALRLAKATGLWSGVSALQLELVLVAGLGGLVLPRLARGGAGPLALGVTVVGAVSAGLLSYPILTMLALAVLHNWTPVGFVAEVTRGATRRRALTLSLVAFAAVPLLIASGLPSRGLDALGAWWPDVGLLTHGGLAPHLGTYLPQQVHAAPWAIAAFSAFVFAQLMHYSAVILVLPRLAPGGPEAPTVLGLSRLPTRTFVAGVVLATAVGLVGYGIDFGDARRWYGLLAGVHAWIEVPVLLLAILPLSEQPATR